MTRLEGKITLVTGSAEGIGLAIAQAYVNEGARVIISDYNQELLDKAEQGFIEQGKEVLKIYADVKEISDVKKLMEAVKSQYGSLDILVNNAGGNVRGDFRHMDEEKVTEVLETNLNGTIRCSREAFDLLKESGNACVLNLSSILANQHMRQVSVYSATKGAVEALTRGMAVEYAAYGIRVNYIAPGFIKTKLTKRFTEHPHISKALLEQTPMRRFGEPHEIANAAVFLASDEAGFITGTGLTVDGGIKSTVV